MLPIATLFENVRSQPFAVPVRVANMKFHAWFWSGWVSIGVIGICAESWRVVVAAVP